jgi:hypothetical protein
VKQEAPLFRAERKSQKNYRRISEKGMEKKRIS